eukprot:TRINITY_DN8713_c0_g1_i1.p1 TRINITY_DN8713_c0_g1~~TRINITY_DN8713_c0_g1_i1.p1  ORF type:complete len:908 (-),score=251.17 TRINITY_DN8713_c0_g1_i1:153-2876(-)
MLQGSDPFLASMHVFAGRTLRAKIQEELAEVPAQAHAALRTSLEAHLRTAHTHQQRLGHGSSGQPLVTQLSLALAALALQLDAPDRLVAGVVEALGTSDVGGAILDVLTALPEEADSARLPLESSRRHAVLGGLQRSSAGVLQLLDSAWPQLSAAHGGAARVLRCLAAWLSLAAAGSVGNVSDWVNHRLLSAAFSVLSSSGKPPQSDDDALMMASVDVVLASVRLTEPPHEHLDAVRLLVPRVLSLRDAFNAAVRSADTERCSGLTAVLLETAETYLPLVMQRVSDVTEPLLAAVLDRTAIADREIASMTFPFWYRLQEQLQGWPAADERAAQCAYFRTTFEQLLHALIQLAEYPADWAELSNDERDEHEQLRHTLADMFRDATAIVGPARALHQLHAMLADRLGQRWQRLEAVLYAVRCLGRTVEGEVDSSGDEALGSAVEQLLALVTRLPLGEPKVRYTGALIVGRYADWLPRRPHFLQPLLSFLTQSLALPDVAAAAALAVKHVCNACRSQLAASSLDALFGVLAGATQHSLPLVAQVELLEGVSYVVSSLPEPASSLPLAIDKLAQPLLDELLRLLNAQRPPPTGPAALPIADALAKLKTVVQFVSPPAGWSGLPPALPVIGRLWPVVLAMFEPMRSDPLVIERLCTLCRYTIKALGGSQFEPYLPSLVSELVRGYSVRPQSCYLYTFNECVGVFGTGPHAAALLAALDELTRHTLLSLPSVEACETHPDLTEEFFELCCRFMRRSPVAFVSSSLLLNVFQQALATINMQHREASRSVLTFVEQLLLLDERLVGRDRSALLATHGEALMRALLYGAAAVIPYSRIGHQAGVLRALMVCVPQESPRWLYSVLQSAFPAYISDALKSDVANQLSNTHGDVSAVRDVLHRFADAFTRAERKAKRRP